MLLSSEFTFHTVPQYCPPVFSERYLFVNMLFKHFVIHAMNSDVLLFTKLVFMSSIMCLDWGIIMLNGKVWGERQVLSMK